VEHEECPGCGAYLPIEGGIAPSHSYVGASPSCWSIFSNLMVGEPEVAPSKLGELVRDAYLAQHHGTLSAQAIQSVAVHLLVLYGVLRLKEAPSRSVWILARASRPELKYKKERFVWLEPPETNQNEKLSEVVTGITPEERRDRLERYIQGVWSNWSARHLEQLATWYQEYIL
jgi:hypothetical protein